MGGNGRELLVAVSFGLAASEAVADRRSSFQIKRWEAYARLYKKVWFLDYPDKPEHINGQKSTCRNQILIRKIIFLGTCVMI